MIGVMPGTRGRGTGEGGKMNRIPGEPCALKGACTVREEVVGDVLKGTCRLFASPGWSLVRIQVGPFIIRSAMPSFSKQSHLHLLFLKKLDIN